MATAPQISPVGRKSEAYSAVCRPAGSVAECAPLFRPTVLPLLPGSNPMKYTRVASATAPPSAIMSFRDSPQAWARHP